MPEPERKATVKCVNCGITNQFCYDLIPWQTLSDHYKHNRAEWAALIADWDKPREPTSAELRQQMRERLGWVGNEYYSGPKEIVACSAECGEFALETLREAEQAAIPAFIPNLITPEQRGLGL